MKGGFAKDRHHPVCTTHFKHIQIVPLTRTLDVIILEEIDQVYGLSNYLGISRPQYLNDINATDA